MQTVDAICERCRRPIRWEGLTNMTCGNCKPLTEAERAIRKVERIIAGGGA